MKKWLRGHLLLFVAGLVLSCQPKTTLTIGVTTTLDDSGLLVALIEEFRKTHNIHIKPIVAGSGEILQLLERGDIESAITHDPNGEQRLLTQGVIQRRDWLMRNDFVLVGPASDPARIRQVLSLDDALNQIVHHQALFVSRADNSGTHQKEQALWQVIGHQPAHNRLLKTGTGMGSSLAVALQKNAYTLVDRGTWLAFNKYLQTNDYQLLFTDPDNPILRNDYHLLSKNTTQATAWENWLRSSEAAAILRSVNTHQ